MKYKIEWHNAGKKMIKVCKSKMELESFKRLLDEKGIMYAWSKSDWYNTMDFTGAGVDL